MTTPDDPDLLRTQIDTARADLAATTTALVAKVDVKKRMKEGAAVAASHMVDSTTGATRRMLRAVTPKPHHQPALGPGVDGEPRRGFLARVRSAIPGQRRRQA